MSPIHRKLPIDIGYYGKTLDYRRVNPSFKTTTTLIVDATGKYGKPDSVNYANAGTLTQDSTGAPIIDLRCKKCRFDLFGKINSLVDEYWHLQAHF